MAIKAPGAPEQLDARAPQREINPPPPRSSRKILGWLFLLLVLGLGYAGFRYYKASQQKQQAETTAQATRAAGRPVPVATVPARSGDMPLYIRGLGNVTPFNTVTVRSRVDGQLQAIHFTEGQNVTKGQLLAEIDPRPFQVQLDQAKGQLARDQAQLNDAKVNLSRYETLWRDQVIAKQQLDTQRASVSQFEGVIEADQANINNANLNISYSRITAPLSGRIGLRLIDVGNMIHANDPNGLVVISQLQPITVMFTIPADNLQPVLTKLRQGVQLHVDAYDRDDVNKIASGTLLTVDNQIDPTTGTSRLKAVFNNNDGALFPNQFVNCRLLLDVKHNAILVPAAAIQRGPQGTYVYVVTPNNTASVRQVTPGITEGNTASIDEGLKTGELVVIDGQDKLQEGTKVDARQGSGRPSGGRRQGGGQGTGSDNPATPHLFPPGAGRPGPGSATPQITPQATPPNPGMQQNPGPQNPGNDRGLGRRRRGA
jgi:multidrug efflux system membrane fusion protein